MIENEDFLSHPVKRAYYNLLNIKIRNNRKLFRANLLRKKSIGIISIKELSSPSLKLSFLLLPE